MSLAIANRPMVPISTPTPAPKLSGEVFATLINLSGRRRFTSQRVVLYAVLAAKKDPTLGGVASDALVLFRDAHIALIKGDDKLPGVFCSSLQEAYFGPEQGDKKIREFIELAERALHAIQSGWRQVPVLLDELIETTTPLLAVLNSITAIYEKEARSHASRTKNQLLDVMSEIKAISKQAHMVAFNAQIIAARAGTAGREFSVVATVMTGITGEIDKLLQAALAESSA
ncbi:methyl-accepting chemotaxis protein [Rhodoferax ferrireducens]|uniref:methyl-accepting chemotaxis protein n=1 Tax=Rhodoferax ferrireducens TaxID=192843 RepID=UPI001E5FF0C2|nr:methyl-accepting chemotaxis protein [Rhodoferax ferrireducens]